jgi:formylmethanofuran dehydrogenase subunit C
MVNGRQIRQGELMVNGQWLMVNGRQIREGELMVNGQWSADSPG